MNTDINKIRNNIDQRNNFIIKYKNFILASASKASGKRITESDDEYSTALSAFNDAITKYEDDKGDFFNFAALIIKRRIIDEHRKQNNHSIPFSSLSFTNNNGETEEFETEGAKDIKSDAAIEIDCLKHDLSKFGLSLFDLPECSPKSQKTKSAVYKVLTFILNNETAKSTILNNNELPAKLICENTLSKPKLLERHRKYIIAATVILTGDYPIISSYIHNLKGVTK